MLDIVLMVFAAPHVAPAVVSFWQLYFGSSCGGARDFERQKTTKTEAGLHKTRLEPAKTGANVQ